MLPLKDDNPTYTFPIVNISLIVINVLVFLYELSLGRGVELIFLQYGIIPFEITHGIDIPPPSSIPINFITSMFLHGGFAHIFGNMLYLWIFGDNIEDAMGHFRYLIFYLITGLFATFTHIFFSPNSKIPTIGASGAISGILGAYLVLYPRAAVLTLVPDPFLFGLFYRIVRIPALFVLGFWFILQFFYGILSLPAKGGGVAWMAHIGGFIAGFILVRIFIKRRYTYF